MNQIACSKRVNSWVACELFNHLPYNLHHWNGVANEAEFPWGRSLILPIFCHAKHRAAGVSAPTIKKSHFVIVRGLFAALGHWNENPYRNHTMCR